MATSFTRPLRFAIAVILSVGLLAFYFVKIRKSGSRDTQLSPTTTTILESEGTSPPASEIGSEAASERLDRTQDLLPQWLLDKGELFRDERDIEGHLVLRTRARFEWENGELLEIEITDIGENADPTIRKALGFNPDLQESETESGYTLTQTEDSYVLNEDYDHNDQAGSLQLLVEDRYLIEIQIENLPHESFQHVLDKEVSFDDFF